MGTPGRLLSVFAFAVAPFAVVSMPVTYEPAWRMNSDSKGNDLAQEGNAPMTADYGQRAANAIDLLVPGPHRDKTVARKFGVSVRMAKYLRAGKHWTADRLTQASAVLGKAFDAELTGEQFKAETAAFEDRLARLEAGFEEMARRHHAQLSSDAAAGAGGSGRRGPEAARSSGRGLDRTERGRASAQPQSGDVAEAGRAMGREVER